jgi:hypothetical protein
VEAALAFLAAEFSEVDGDGLIRLRRGDFDMGSSTRQLAALTGRA